jgi:hypothetical protein
MKTTALVALITLLVFSQMAVAQDTQELSVLLDRLHGNHMGSIYDVFTIEEVAQLRAHFDAKSTVEPVRYGGGTLIRTTENTQGNFSNIDPDDLSMVEIVAPSPLMDFEGAGAIVPGTTNSIVAANNNTFYGVDAAGNYDNLGAILPAAGQSFTGLEYTSDGQLYGIATDGMGSTTLYEIDLVNETAMAVGSPNGLVVGIALGRDMNNNLYSYDIDTDMVHRINRMTGVATMLGPIGFDAEFGQGLSYDGTGDNLVASVFNSDTFKPELRIIDITTGASTFVGTIMPSATLQFAWMGIFDPTLSVPDAHAKVFSMFPNPANTTLTIAAEVNIQAIKIYNTLGQKILMQSFDASTIAIDVSKFASGIYFVQITAGDSQTALQFIKE